MAESKVVLEIAPEHVFSIHNVAKREMITKERAEEFVKPLLQAVEEGKVRLTACADHLRDYHSLQVIMKVVLSGHSCSREAATVFAAALEKLEHLVIADFSDFIAGRKDEVMHLRMRLHISIPFPQEVKEVLEILSAPLKQRKLVELNLRYFLTSSSRFGQHSASSIDSCCPATMRSATAA